MRGSLVLTFIVAAAAGCAPQPAPDTSGLARELAGYTPGQPQSCIGTFANQNLRVIDPQTIAYGNGRTIYVNKLQAPCPAVDQLNTLIVEAQVGQYCRGDRVRGLEPGGIIPGPSCVLQDWVPYRR